MKSLRNTWLRFLLVPVLLWALFPQHLVAQESLSLTVTPPLIQLTIGPGESWSSSLKIVNTNAYDVTYYATVVDFESQGELGKGKFIPVLESPDPAEIGHSLAQWVQVSSDPIPVVRGGNADVPFSVQVPENAEPGGHYAAILIGTEPVGSGASGPSAKIATRVTSLLFVKISGEVRETGRIREFITENVLYQTPKADFVLRFENTGNTHLRPRGDVKIFNMWGKERGQVTINQESQFGNVLPESIRKFEFAWEGESNPFEIGRYSAIATLSYGDELKQNTVATTYFWVVPIVPVSIALGSIISLILLLTWLIRRYVRRALMLERIRAGVPREDVAAPVVRAQARPAPTVVTLMEPIRETVVDLRAVVRHGGVVDMRGGSVPVAKAPERMSAGEFLKKYQLLFVFIVLIAAILIGLSLYLKKVLVSNRTYEITDIQSQVESLPENEKISP